MSSILTAPPAIEPLSLAEAKAHLRVGHADEDALISTLIVAARRHAEAQTGLALIAQGWSHFRDDWPEGGVVALPLQPLMTVGDVSVFDANDVASVVDPALYYADKAGHPPRLMLKTPWAWARPGRIGNGIEIAVTIGFGAAASDVPEELRQAMLQLVAHGYENRGTGSEASMPLTVAAVIERFREKRL